MTTQEMFDRAWRGLASQGWKSCIDADGNCLYFDPSTGFRCAWGWVDPEGTQNKFNVTVDELDDGIAPTLSDDEMEFATSLQLIHDTVDDDDMEGSMRALALEYTLTIPEAP